VAVELERFLTAAGQPVSRDGAAYRYCVEGAAGEQPQVVDVVFDEGGAAAELVASSRPAPASLDAPSAPAPVVAAGATAAGAAARPRAQRQRLG
jgi:hypothetical protein